MVARLLVISFLAFTRVGGAADVDRAAQWEERMLDDVNADRAERGLPRYRRDRQLEQAAAQHTRRMAETGELAHQLPGEPRLRDRVAATGLRFDRVGENVGYSTRVEELHSNLMRSPEHRDNLLSRRYDSIGIAIYESDGRYWVTQDFAHTTSDATVPEAEEAFADALIALRRRRGLAPIEVQQSDTLREASCAMARRDQIDARGVPRQRGQRRVVVFTSFEPDQLNDRARSIASDREARRVLVGACHRASRRYPSGVFWFAVTY